MIDSWDEINAELSKMGLAQLDGMGIGIHYGEVILGDIGGERKDYTLIGDAVNTTTRLEALCKTYQSPLIISQSCYAFLEPLLQQRFTCLSSLALKGKEEKVTFYGLLR
jgi:adenylate cyclase